MLQVVIKLYTLPVVHFSSKSLTLPQKHVISYLVALKFQGQSRQPVWNKTVGVHFVVHYLVRFVLGLNELLKGHFEQWTAQKNKHCCWPVLDDCCIKHETSNTEWQVQVIVQVSDAQELFLLVWLNVVSVNLLFELSHVLFVVFEHLLQLWIIASFPLGFPCKGQPVNFRNDLLMDVSEMQNISAVFRNVLDMAHHMVLGPASEF